MRSSSRLLARQPRVRRLDALLSIAECAQLRNLAASRMQACELSEIASAAGQHKRSSTGCWLPRYDSPRRAWNALGATDADIELVGRVEKLLADLCGLPRSHGEPPQILRYRQGQQYDPHPDFFDPHDREELANGGQRLMTCLVYLTTVPPECGGATHFPRGKPVEREAGAARRGLRIQPTQGTAVFWNNTLPSGAVDPRSIHSGELVRQGRRKGMEKWVFSKWMRQRTFTVDHDAFASP